MSHTEKGYPVVIRSMPKSRFPNHGDVKKFIHEILSSRKHDDRLKPKDGATSAHNSSPSAQAEVKIRGVYFPVPSQLFPTSTTPCWRKHTPVNDERILADQVAHLSLSDTKATEPEYRDAVIHFSIKTDAVEFSCLCEDRQDGYFVDDIAVQIFNKMTAEIDMDTVMAVRKNGYRMGMTEEIMRRNAGVCFLVKENKSWIIEGYEWQIMLAKNVLRSIVGNSDEIAQSMNLSSTESFETTSAKDVGCQYEEQESLKSVLSQTDNWTESVIPLNDSITKQSLTHGYRNGNQDLVANESMYNGAESVGIEAGDSKRVSIHHQDSPAAPSKQQPEVQSLRKHGYGNTPGMTYGSRTTPNNSAVMEQESPTDGLNNDRISKPDLGQIPPRFGGKCESDRVTSSGSYKTTADDGKSRSINSPIRTTEDTRSIDDQLFGEDKNMTNLTGSRDKVLEDVRSGHAKEPANDASTQTLVNGVGGSMGLESINPAAHESEELLGYCSHEYPEMSRKDAPNRPRSRTYPCPDCETRNVPNHSKTGSQRSSEIQKPQFPKRESTKLTPAIQREMAPSEEIENRAEVGFNSRADESNDDNSRDPATGSQQQTKENFLTKTTDYNDQSMETDDDQLNPTPGSSTVFKQRLESSKSDDKYVSKMKDIPSRKQTGGPEVDQRIPSGKYENVRRDRIAVGDSQAPQRANAPQMADALQVADSPKMAHEENDMAEFKDSYVSDEHDGDIEDDQYHDDSHSGDFKQLPDSNPEEEHFHVRETSENYHDSLHINLNFWNFIQSKDSGFRKQIDSLENTLNVRVVVKARASEVKVSGEKDSVEKAMKKIKDMYTGVEFNLEERPLGHLQGLLQIDELNESYPEVLFTCTHDERIFVVGHSDQIQTCLRDLRQKASELSQGRGAERSKDKVESNLSPRTERPRDKAESNPSPRTERPRDKAESNLSPRTERPRDKAKSMQVSEASVTDPDEMGHREKNLGSSDSTKHNEKQISLAAKDVVSRTFLSQPVMLDTQAYNFMTSFYHNELGKITKFCRIHDKVVDEMTEVSVEADDGTIVISCMDEITGIFQTIFRNVVTETLNYRQDITKKLKEKLSEKAVSYVIDESEDNKVIMTYPKDDAQTVADIKKSLPLRRKERKLAKSPTNSETISGDSPKTFPHPAAPVTASSSLIPGGALPFQASGFLLYGKTLLLVHICDITKLKVDAIVNAANGDLRHGGGIAAAISKAAGPKLNRECRELVSRYGQVPDSQVAETTAGDLPSKMVLHAVGPVWPKYGLEYQNRCIKVLNATFRNVLSRAKEKKIKSLAMPAISSGVFGVPKHLVATTMYNVINNYAMDSNLEEIHIVDVTDDILQMVSQYFLTHTQQDPTAVSSLSDNNVQRCIQQRLPGLPKGFMLPGGVSVLVHQADITKLLVDVIVCSTNEKLGTHSGVAKAIAAASGKHVEEQLRHLVKAHECQVMDIYKTPGSGSLNRTVVFYAVAPDWDYKCKLYETDRNTCKEQLYMTFNNIIREAGDSNIQTIAIPPVGAGGRGIPQEIVVSMLCESLISSLQSKTTLQEIHIVDVNDAILKRIVEELMSADLRIVIPMDQADVYNIISSRAPWSVRAGPVINKSLPVDYKDHGGSRYQRHQPMSLTVPSEGSSVDHPGEPELGTDALEELANGSTQYVNDPLRSAPNAMDMTRNSGAIPKSYANAVGHGSQRSERNGVLKDASSSTRSSAHSAHHNGGQIRVGSGSSNQTLQSHHDRNQTSERGSNGEVYDSGYRRRRGDNGGGKGDSKPSDKTELAVNKAEATSQQPDTCVICMTDITDPKALEKCKHKFCRECIDEAFQKCGPKCPSCGEMYGTITGTQPTGGTMNFNKHWLHLPGYPGCGSMVVNYYIPSGTQGPEHPHPGRHYQGTSRTAYLPDNPEGNHVLTLLRRAFDARLIFTVGRSSTTGHDDQVIWNDIHHKTSPTGGTNQYGYPDPTYLSRVQEELAAKGIK